MKHCIGLLGCLVLPALAAEPPAAALDAATARRYFQEAQQICTADSGRLWGVSLCGPIMFVDPRSRRVIANQKDGEGALVEADGVFTGLLPTAVNVASTATPWSGVRWSQIVWPLPEDRIQRHTLLTHELFHRIQNQVPVLAQDESANAHLDTLEGRYLLQLEWRALSAALQCTAQPTCKRALSDALLFRAARYQQFPEAAAQERALEFNEGLAEYTGVVVGNPDPAEQLQAALWDLSAHVRDATFVRSFAYATGPTLGLLLDKYAPGWRAELRSNPSLNDLLQRAAAIQLPRDIKTAAANSALRYDGTTLRRAEVEREQQRQKILARNRARFVEGPVLTLPMLNANVQFNPQNLQPLDDAGTVYPTLRISAAWGVLEVSNGALLRPDWSAVSVVAPAKNAIGTSENLAGDGWTLALKSQWKVVPATRGGDFTLQASPPPTSPH